MGSKIKLKLKLSRSLKKHDKVKDIIKQGVELIKEVNGYEDQKLHQNLTLTVMKSVQKACKYIDGEVDKNTMVSEILKGVYSLTDEELLVIEQQMLDIIDNQELLSSFFLSKFLRQVWKFTKRSIL